MSNPALILWDLETVARSFSLKAMRRAMRIIAKEVGASRVVLVSVRDG